MTTTYTYDECCQGENLISIAYSDDTPGSAFTYDRLGRQGTITDLLGTRTNEYDAATLQLIAEKLPDGTVLSRAQDEFGRPAGISLGPDYAVEYAYDALGRFHSVSSAYAVVEYDYLQGSDLLSGWSSSEGNSHTRSFEPNRNLITGIENQHGTNLISSFAYTNDELGRRTARVDSASVTNTFGYNTRSEVVAAIMGENDHAYAYDPIGNRLHAILNGSTNNYTANDLNQYTSISNGIPVEPTYDDDGNMLTHGDWTFTWDGENRLVEVASNAVTVVESQYDYMSRRIMKSTAMQTNSYLYDGWNLLRETSAASTNHYVWGLDLSQSMQGAGGVGGLLMTVHDGDSFFPAYDANGNITEYSATNGTIVAHYEYDPFGNVSAHTGSMADDFVYRFSTKYTDDETGLVWYGYRFLNPELGRWINRDPIEEEGGVNLYEFTRNNSILAYDIMGLLVWTESIMEIASDPPPPISGPPVSRKPHTDMCCFAEAMGSPGAIDGIPGYAGCAACLSSCSASCGGIWQCWVGCLAANLSCQGCGVDLALAYFECTDFQACFQCQKTGTRKVRGWSRPGGVTDRCQYDRGCAPPKVIRVPRGSVCPTLDVDLHEVVRIQCPNS